MSVQDPGTQEHREELLRIRQMYDDLRRELHVRQDGATMTRRRGVLTSAGVVAESICRFVFRREGLELGDKPADKLMLDELIQKLQSRKAVPEPTCLHLRHVHQWRNVGAHDKADVREGVDDELLDDVIRALNRVIVWFFQTYIGGEFASLADTPAQQDRASVKPRQVAIQEWTEELWWMGRDGLANIRRIDLRSLDALRLKLGLTDSDTESIRAKCVRKAESFVELLKQAGAHGGVSANEAEGLELERQECCISRREAQQLAAQFLRGEQITPGAPEWLTSSPAPAMRSSEDLREILAWIETKEYQKALPALRKRALEGNARAMFELGNCYEDGLGLSADQAEAETWFRKAAESARPLAAAGDAEAAVALALGLEFGSGVAKNEAEAVTLYRAAAEAGNPEAMLRLGDCYAEGCGVAGDKAEAVNWYRRAAELGDAEAMCLLGTRLVEGEGVSKDDAEAARWFRKAAEVGNDTGMCFLGTCYQIGTGVAEDQAEAARWFRKAADAGNDVAMTSLADCLFAGNGTGVDKVEAVSWYRKAAALGNTEAMVDLGDCYRLGAGVKKDWSEAASWYRKAADTGDGTGMFWVAHCFDTGRGVPFDKAEALRWFRKAAEAGFSVAMALLGMRYSIGQGVKKDEAEAVRWYRKAADAGNAYAMRKLATALRHGRGTEKDLAEAKEWGKRAREAKSAEEGIDPPSDPDQENPA